MASSAILGEGAAVPSVTFKCRVRKPDSKEENPFDWKDVSSDQLFKGKRVALFSLPGAFTPTCSATHLPGYESKYEALKAAGVDEVYCLSVNDAFVMRKWGLDQGLDEEKQDGAHPMNPGNFKKVKLIPDGAALFTRGMGASCTWESERGFGERSWRYSCVISDGKLEKMFVEGGSVSQNSGPDPFKVSDADTMLAYLKGTTKILSEGAAVPSVTFKCRVRKPGSKEENPFDWKDVSSDQLFKGKKRVALFSLPGAFTPTCSATHLPGYESKYEALKSAGVDEVYCLSVNDAFVMRKWGLDQGLDEEKEDGAHPMNPGNFKRVKLIPDGAALFTRGMGASCTWGSERGFGERSWRYSAVINDGKVEKMFVEGGEVAQNSGPDPFKVSDADTMLAYLKKA